MGRSNRSARQAGTKFERDIANHLAAGFDDDRIDRRVKMGSADRGDIAGFRFSGRRIVVECKDVSKMNLGGWVNEAEVERGNDDADVGMVIHKRRGHGQPGDQYVTMTVDNLLRLLGADVPLER